MKNKKVIILLSVIILAVVILGAIYILNSKRFNEDIVFIEYTTGGGFGTQADCEEISIKFNEDNRIEISAINGKLEKVISVSENDVAELKNIIKENILDLKEDLSDDDALDSSYSYITINNIKFGGYAVSNKNFIEIKNKILEIVGQEEVKEFRESISEYYEKSINSSKLNNVTYYMDTGSEIAEIEDSGNTILTIFTDGGDGSTKISGELSQENLNLIDEILKDLDLQKDNYKIYYDYRNYEISENYKMQYLVGQGIRNLLSDNEITQIKGICVLNILKNMSTEDKNWNDISSYCQDMEDNKELVEDILLVKEGKEPVNAKYDDTVVPSIYKGDDYTITVALGGDCTDYIFQVNGITIYSYTRIYKQEVIE